MMWAFLLLVAVIVAVHWWEYSTAIQEYTFAQPATLDRHDELRSVLGEKTPVAVEIGALPWRPEVVEKSTWSAVVEGEAGVQMEMPAAQWDRRQELCNGTALATQMDLATGLADLDAARAWWWLPGIYDAKVSMIQKGGVVGLQWVTAERQWIGCSHGGPLTIWLVHGRYRRYLPADAVDPWALTVAEAPWIGRVQFVEVTVKPGWCLGLPAHWGYGVRAEEEAWVWTAAQQSALSWTLSPEEEDQ
jgi:hypothetical protein